jgi:hypothetical protein
MKKARLGGYHGDTMAGHIKRRGSGVEEGWLGSGSVPASANAFAPVTRHQPSFRAGSYLPERRCNLSEPRQMQCPTQASFHVPQDGAFLCAQPLCPHDSPPEAGLFHRVPLLTKCRNFGYYQVV